MTERLDCSAVMVDLQLLIDNECDAEARARLQKHLEDCSPCLAHYGLQTEIKNLIGRKCGGESAPQGLRARIAAQLTAIEFVGSDGSTNVSMSSVRVSSVQTQITPD